MPKILPPVIDTISKIPIIKEHFLRRYSSIRFQLFKVGRFMPLLKFPRYVHLLVTYDCNFRCGQCQVDGGGRKVRQLTHDEIIKVIRDIKKAGTRHLIITGGEPLLRKDIFDILRFARDVGIPKITLATNGYLVEKFEKELSESKIDKVVTSIDDTRERNDELRGKKGAFDKAIRALEFFKKIGVPIREINTTVLPGKISHMEELAGHVKGSAATNWVLGPLIPIGRANFLGKGTFEDQEIKELVDLVERLRPSLPVELLSHLGYLEIDYRKITSEPFFCRAGLECCSVNPDGNVVACNMVSDPRFSQGNLRDKDFRTIWREGFQEQRNPRFPEECENCEFLHACRGGCWGFRAIGAKYCFLDSKR